MRLADVVAGVFGPRRGDEQREDSAPRKARAKSGRGFSFRRSTFRSTMTYHVMIIFSIFLFIAIAMLATVWDMGR